ncbi:GTPase ObgE [Candidatus Roizmanbacteria bacterium]|nr:GTPase ObgE [Candidatus Roizmanbacteria bacterium]
MLVTEVTILFKAGDGGNGKVSFNRGNRTPDGGNGGRGGDIYITATSDIYALYYLTTIQQVEAENGHNGMSNNKQGKAGADREIKLPIGSVFTDVHSHKTSEIRKMGDRFFICRGGDGGMGNREYRSGSNTTPRYAQPGFSGEQRTIHINLKLIADVGFIGFPNTGKSSLLKALTAATPKIADYPFTTLEPNLGVLDKKIIADIPGLIEGASEGKGLGIEFLKHIERVSLLFHCISVESQDPEKDYRIIRNEMKEYNDKILDIPEIILLTKSDIKTREEMKDSLALLKKLNRPIILVSIHNADSIEKLKRRILDDYRS